MLARIAVILAKSGWVGTILVYWDLEAGPRLSSFFCGIDVNAAVEAVRYFAR
jgi:hypothetical protein